MATASPFKFRQPFPFCAADISGSVAADAAFEDNLDLADVMAIGWNLEHLKYDISAGSTASKTVSGTTAILNAAMQFGFDSASISSNYFDAARLSSTGATESNMAWGDYSGFNPATAFGSCPALRQPVSRVCFGSGWALGLVFVMNWTLLADGSQFFGHAVWVGTDPINSGKYRLYSNITGNRTEDNPPASVSMRWNQNATPPAGYALVSSGLYFVHSYGPFPYYCYSNGDTYSGGNFDIFESALFTY